MPFERGPILHCDDDDINRLRSFLRSAIDKLWYERDRSAPTFANYQDEVRKILKKQVEKARSHLNLDFPDGATFAPSLISGLAAVWNPVAGRITVLLDKTGARVDTADTLDALTISPVHAFCQMPPNKRNLWLRLQKSAPDEKGCRPVLSLDQFSPLYDDLPPEAHGDAKRHAQIAFEAAPGNYLWLFGFDAEKPPSPSRVVAVSTDNPEADHDPDIRRWLNVLAAVLGEVAAIERSMATFLRSLQARTKVVKADENRWEIIVRAQKSWDHLDRVSESLGTGEVHDAAEGMLALLPKSKGVDAHRLSVIEMPHYDTPSLREALLQRRAFDNEQAVRRTICGILRKLNGTFYKNPILDFYPNDDTAKPRQDNRIQTYFKTVHLAKYGERAELVRAYIDRLRHNSSLSPLEGRMIEAISEVYNDQSVNVTCRYGDDFRTPKMTDNDEKFQWKTKSTVPVYSVLSAVESSEELQSLLRPVELYWTHGDLHFHNILIDLGDLDDPLFKLIDANIDNDGRDIVADLSKVLQSCDALGDFLHERLFEIKAFLPPAPGNGLWQIELSVGRGTMTYALSGGVSGAKVFRYLRTQEQLQHYRSIANNFCTLAVQCIPLLNDDESWQARALFGLAINLLTSSPFFIEEKPDVALAFAVSGAMILTEWCRRKDVNHLLANAQFSHPSIVI